MNHTPMSDEEFSLRMDMYNSACVQIAALKEQNQDMLAALKDAYKIIRRHEKAWLGPKDRSEGGYIG